MLGSAIVNPVVPAGDLERARAFYADKLGLKPMVETEDGLVFSCRGTWFLLYQSMAAGTNQATAIEFIVDDLDATMSDLRSRGVGFIEYDFPEFSTVDGVAASPFGKNAWFHDSEGNIISIAQIVDPEMRGQMEAMVAR